MPASRRSHFSPTRSSNGYTWFSHAALSHASASSRTFSGLSDERSLSWVGSLVMSNSSQLCSLSLVRRR